MNKNAKKWVKALRSGKYKQGRLHLTQIVKGEERHCCLGVACVLYAKEHPDFSVRVDHNKVMYDSHSYSLPSEVREWLGLKEVDGTYLRGRGSLIGLNDASKRNYNYIADRIEAEPKGLFA
jgi:hypothetical protein